MNRVAGDIPDHEMGRARAPPRASGRGKEGKRADGERGITCDCDLKLS